jgi:hypothetical protein
MKIRLDDVMQSFSYPFHATYYYYIPLETVLMFMNGMIYGKAVHGITTEEDVKARKEDFIKLPDLGENGRYKVMYGFMSAIPDGSAKEKVLAGLTERGFEGFDEAVREEKLLLKWFNYRDGIIKEFSRRWCRENGLELIE